MAALGLRNAVQVTGARRRDGTWANPEAADLGYPEITSNKISFTFKRHFRRSFGEPRAVSKEQSET